MSYHIWAAGGACEIVAVLHQPLPLEDLTPSFCGVVLLRSIIDIRFVASMEIIQSVLSNCWE
jgi:hypothetical protein